jgi:hypothetical protein
MLSEKAVSRGMIEFEYRENQLAVFLTEVRHPAVAALSNVLTPTLDASQTVGRITKLCRKLGVAISRFGMFPVEKTNDYSPARAP